MDMSPASRSNPGFGLVPRGVEGVFGREPSWDGLGGEPGKGVSEVFLVLRRRDSADNAALYFLAVPRMDGVVERAISELDDEIDSSRFGVNGTARANLEPELRLDGAVIVEWSSRGQTIASSFDGMNSCWSTVGGFAVTRNRTRPGHVN